MANLMENVISTIRKYDMIKSGDSIVVGVSGGADSLSLLHVLHILEKKYNLKLYVAHLNHQFRGKDADEDAEYVAEICHYWGIPAFIETFDVPAYAEETGLSPEEAGREIRYRLFEAIMEKTGSNKIAVAQNLNDHAETVLMRFLRGSGIDGLRGIEPVRGNIIRPLIETDRSTIESYCAENELEPRIDKTNLEPVYLRNKIRLELLPYLKKEFNPNIVGSMIRLSQMVRDENEYLDIQAQEAFSRVSRNDEEVSFGINTLVGVHKSLQRRMIRMAIERLSGSLTGYEFKHVDMVLELASQPTGAAVILPKGIKAYTSYGRIVITKNIVKTDKKCYYKLKYDCDNIIKAEDITISIWKKDISEVGDVRKEKLTVFIDRSKIKNDLTFRNRLDGDVFSPIGMKGSKKLKEYFIDEKVPREERDAIPLLADGQEIVWVVGKRLSENYKITPDTKDILVIKFLRGTYNEE